MSNVGVHAVAMALAMHLIGCAEFPQESPGCGNRILEEGEACDNPNDDLCGKRDEAVQACRFVCEPGADPSGCEGDLLCGNDGVCREPSGTFVRDRIVIDEEGTSWIRVGELDGDPAGNLRDDLVVGFAAPDASDVKAFFFRADGAVELVMLRDPLVAGGAAADLSGDGLDDVFVADTETSNVTVWRMTGGAPELTYFPTLRTQGATGPLLSATPVRDRVLELVGPSTTRHWPNDAANAVEVEPLGMGGAALNGAIAVADLDDGVQCEAAPGAVAFGQREVALAAAGAQSVRIASTCGGATGFEFVGDVALPGNRKLGEAGAFFVHADAGDRLDLVTQDRTGRVWVAYGADGTTFHSEPGLATPGDGRFAATPILDHTELGLLLSVADFDEDPTVELVTETAYIPSPESCTPGACTAAPWAEEAVDAVPVDLNGDGVLDLAVLIDDFVLVNLGVGGGDDPFLDRPEEFRGPVREAAVGDFNRDTIPDLAFVTLEEDPETAADDYITVLYGGQPDALRRQEFSPHVDVQALAVEEGSTLVARTLDDRGRASGAFIRVGEGEHNFGVTIGFPAAVQTRSSPQIGAVVVGPQDSAPRLGYFGFLGGSLSPHDVTSGDLLDAPPSVEGFARPVAADLDGDGNDELIIAGLDLAQAGRVWVARLDVDERQWRLAGQFTVDAVGPRSALGVGDADGDGDLDVLISTDEPARRVVLLRNDAGVLSGGSAVVLGLSSGFDVADIASWHPAGGLARWLVAGGSGVAVASVDVDASTLALARVVDEPSVAVAAADVDGDGLLDLVYGTTFQLYVRLAEETLGEP